MKLKKPIWIVTIVIVLAGAAWFFLLRRSGDELARLRNLGPLNVILITVDTLRADRIHCYGYEGVETPTMDMFAARGVRFERCVAQTPLTLPSHTSLLTGTFPTFHGVRDNGGFLVPPQLETMAESFKKAGYDTSAFVASYVLDSKWGLNQGFDTYFDRFDLSKYKTISLGNVQRRGDEVIDETLAWLDQHKAGPFFSWIHLYDPHTPYEPPPPFDTRYSNRPYVGEIAYTDSQLARLWLYLESQGLVENTVLVFTSDHGESLGEHQESTHGFFIYQEGIHVPLIIVTPVEKYRGHTNGSVVTLVDIMPTVLEMAGLPLPDQLQGRSLLPLMTGEKKFEDSFAYAETYYPRFHYGWSELKSVQDRRFKLVIAPDLELYDLDNDPDEMSNLVVSMPQETRRLMEWANSFLEESGQNALEMDYSKMDEESRQKLAALGYIGTFTDASSLQGRRLGDPKEKIVVFNQLSEAKEMGLQGETEEALQLIDRIIADDPDIIDAYFMKGNLYFKDNRFQEALDTFRIVLDKKPDDDFTAINIANSHIRLGQLDEAESFLTDFVRTVPPDSQIYLILGNISYIQREFDEAEKHYLKCIELNPASASAFTALGGIYVITERLDEAKSLLDKALASNPSLPNLHYNFAQLWEAKNDPAAAEKEYRVELENVPHNFRASFNLSRLCRLQNRTDEEQAFLEQTVESNPRFPMPYLYLARIYLNRSENYQEAVDLVLKGIELKPEEKDLPLGYFLLADLYNRLGNQVKSEEFAVKGRQLVDKLRSKGQAG
ncbi:MAG: sulfatase-like hydrolase/transferase [Acidobacteria bacterium]|nr:sulfatase-like hydrolase/transferase [Acidobacteriota bacterium]MBU2439213.1 sulfatase-like hydrolase/transferase [Acidobacteriota bacterium]